MTLRHAQGERGETVWQGRYIEARRDGRWEWAARARGIGAAVILATDDDGRVLLVEQYRVPLGARTIELPAGLVGDEETGEAVEASALRELEEETGWRAQRVERLGRFASSPGMVSETFELVRAVGLRETGADPEDGIVVHRIASADLPDFLAARRAEGLIVDVKLLALLSFV